MHALVMLSLLESDEEHVVIIAGSIMLIELNLLFKLKQIQFN